MGKSIWMNAEATKPEPREPVQRGWEPAMEAEGLSLWSVTLGVDRMHPPVSDYTLHVLSCIENQPSVPVPYEPMRLMEGGMDWGWGPRLRAWIVCGSMPEAIETTLANAEWWAREMRSRN